MNSGEGLKISKASKQSPASEDLRYVKRRANLDQISKFSKAKLKPKECL
jgi:hypothetical protein